MFWFKLHTWKFNFHPLEVVGRGSDTQLQVGENLKYLFSTISRNEITEVITITFIHYISTCTQKCFLRIQIAKLLFIIFLIFVRYILYSLHLYACVVLMCMSESWIVGKIHLFWYVLYFSPHLMSHPPELRIYKVNPRGRRTLNQWFFIVGPAFATLAQQSNNIK